MEKHRDMEAPVEYIKDFLNIEWADGAFDILMYIDWVQRENTPRMEYYCNDTDAPYTYGTGPGQRTYFPQKWPKTVYGIRYELEDYFDRIYGVEYRFDVCFLNRYDTAKEGLSWHADDSPEMDPARPVVTVSLGCERDIEFRRNSDGYKERLTLGHGSMASMMPGMQQLWQHRIPKAGFVATPRISLTYRGYLPQ